jgi:hypothetical protein
VPAALYLNPVKSLFLSALLFLSTLLGAASLSAAPAIGIVSASGHFTVGGSEVWGNATLFDGTVVQTTSASSELALRNGVKVQLAAGSRAQVYADRLVLDAGTGQVAQAAPFEVDAGGLQVRGAGVRVGLGRTIEIAALTGAAKVSGKGGVLLAAIPAGHRMNLAFQAAQSGTLTRSGCLVYRDAHFILQDDSTQEVVELNGNAQDLSKNLGNRVEVKGTASGARPAVSIATSVLAVSAVSPQSEGGCLVVASNLNAQTEMPKEGASKAAAAAAGAAGGAAAGGAAAGAATGISAGAVVGIVAGGGAAAGTAAYFATRSSKSSTSP